MSAQKEKTERIRREQLQGLSDFYGHITGNTNRNVPPTMHKSTNSAQNLLAQPNGTPPQQPAAQ